MRTPAAFRTSFLILISGISLSLFAQSESPGPRFRTFGWGLRLDDLFYSFEGKDTPVRVYDGVRSPFLPLPAALEGPLVFYRMTIDEEGMVLRAPVVEVVVHDKGAWPLILFFPSDEEEEKTYECLVLADDLESHPAPSIRFINLTAVPLGIQVGEALAVVSPRNITLMDPEVSKEDGKTVTRFTSLYVKTEEGPEKVYSNNWAVRPTQRTLVLIHVQNDRLGVRRVLDDESQYRIASE